MRKFTVCTKVFNTRAKPDEERRQWKPVGTLIYFPAGQDMGKPVPESCLLELNMFPDTPFYLFPQEPDEPGTKG